MELSIYEAKTGFSKVIASVEAGESVVVKRRNKPVARIIPIRASKGQRVGALKGRPLHMSDHFIESGSEEFGDLFGMPKKESA